LPFGNHARPSRLSGESPGGAGLLSSRPALQAALRLVELALWSVALVAAGTLSYIALDRVVHRGQQSRQLQLARATSAVAPTAPLPLENGDLIGLLEIPSAGISEIVSEGTDALTLRRGVGHIHGTARPGEPGNIALAGHRDTVFRGLRKLRPADRIVLVTAGGSFEYAVEALQTVAPERTDVLDAGSHPTLTLVTCYPFDFIGPAPLRYVVRAREIGRTFTGQ
jgi:sortase A